MHRRSDGQTDAHTQAHTQILQYARNARQVTITNLYASTEKRTHILTRTHANHAIRQKCQTGNNNKPLCIHGETDKQTHILTRTHANHAIRQKCQTGHNDKPLCIHGETDKRTHIVTRRHAQLQELEILRESLLPLNLRSLSSFTAGCCCPWSEVVWTFRELKMEAAVVIGAVSKSGFHDAGANLTPRRVIPAMTAVCLFVLLVYLFVF